MDTTTVLKAIADETRMKILTLLLRHSYCVRGLANALELTEATISQHLKVLREAGLLVGEKRGYFMHYDVERSALHELAGEIEALPLLNVPPADRPNAMTAPLKNRRAASKKANAAMRSRNFVTVQSKTRRARHEHCQCRKSEKDIWRFYRG